MALLFFGMDLMKINWYLVLYILLSIVALFYGSSKLSPFGTGRTIIYAIGGALIFMYFGFRWFSNNKQKSKVWPPVINMCPDYLTYRAGTHNNNGTTSSDGCVDLLGVSSNGTFKKITKNDISTATSTNHTLFKYTNKDITPSTSVETLQTICNYCKTEGLTWEGVFDGDICSAIATVSATGSDENVCRNSNFFGMV